MVSFYVEAIFSRRFKRREIRRFNSFQVCRQNTGVREVVANLENTIAITNYSALLGGGGGGGLSHTKYLHMSGLGGYVMVGKQIKGLNNMLLDWVEFQGNHESDQQIYFFICAWVLE